MEPTDNPRKKLYNAILSAPDQDMVNAVKRFSFKKFNDLLLTNPEYQKDLYLDLKDSGMADDEESFFKEYVNSSQPPSPSLSPNQPQSIDQITSGQATGFTPDQSTQQEAVGQPQTGEFGIEMVGGKPRAVAQGMTFGGQQVAAKQVADAIDPTGQEYSQGVLMDEKGLDLQGQLRGLVNHTPEDKQQMAYQNAQNVKNDAKSSWQRLKETGQGLWTSAKTQADAAMGFLDTVLNPMSFVPGASKPVEQGGFGGETNLAKGAKKEFIRTAMEGEKELNNKIQELGLQTDIVDAVKSGRGSDIIQAINHNIGQMAYQVPLSISTFGASSFAMEGAEAYKNIVDSQAKALGITTDELIEKGLDQHALGTAIGVISGAVDYLGAKSLASFINAGGAYEQLAKAIASKLPKKYGIPFLTKAVVASNAEGFQEAIQEGLKLGGERIASGKWNEDAWDRIGKSYANAAVGAGGTYVGATVPNMAASAVRKDLEQNIDPDLSGIGSDLIGQAPTELGGIPTQPADPNDPAFQEEIPTNEIINTDNGTNEVVVDSEQPVVDPTGNQVVTQESAGVDGGGVITTETADMRNPITEEVVQEEIPEVDAIPIANVDGIPDYNPEELSIGENIYYSFDGKDYHKGEVVSQPSAAKKNVYTIKNENGVPTVIIYGGERTNVKLKSDATNATPQQTPLADPAQQIPANETGGANVESGNELAVAESGGPALEVQDDAGVDNGAEVVGEEKAVKPAFESNIEALVNPETGLAAVVRKSIEKTKPFIDKFLNRVGVTIEEYKNASDAEKESLDKQWRESPEYAESEKPIVKEKPVALTKTESKEGGTESQDNAEKGTGGSRTPFQTKREDGVDADRVVYHGTKGSFDEFDDSFLGSNTGANSAKEGFFFATNKDVAISYASEANRIREELAKDAELAEKELMNITGDTPSGYTYSKNKGYKMEFGKTQKEIQENNEKIKNIFDRINKFGEYDMSFQHEPVWNKNEIAKDASLKEVKLEMKNPLIYDFKGESYRDESYSDIIKKAKEDGYDSVIFKNTYDGNNPFARNMLTDIHVVFDKSQIKSDSKINKEEAVSKSPLEAFSTKGELGQKARAALKESVGSTEFKRLESIAKNGEKILKDLQTRNILKIDCP